MNNDDYICDENDYDYIQESNLPDDDVDLERIYYQMDVKDEIERKLESLGNYTYKENTIYIEDNKKIKRATDLTLKKPQTKSVIQKLKGYVEE